MSKKTKGKEKSSENDSILSDKNVEKAQTLYITPLNISFKLKNVLQIPFF